MAGRRRFALSGTAHAAARVAYREFSANPDLPDDTFQAALGRDLFGPDWRPVQVQDTLELRAASLVRTATGPYLRR